MAGIGFALRDLSRRDGIIGPAASLGHGAVIAAGPWIFTVLSIAIIHQATAEILTDEVSYAFRGLVIYAFALSLLATAPIVNVAIRQVADDIFLGAFHNVRPHYVATLALCSLASAATAGTVLILIFGVSGLDLAIGVASTTVVGLIWPTLAFCGAVRDYSGITAGFLLGLLTSVTATIWGAYSGWSAALMMAAFTVGLGIVFFGLASRVLATFPHPVTDIRRPLARLFRGFARYRLLALGSAIAITALWIDKWIMWFGPHGVALTNGLISAPFYDGAMFVAYLVIIPALGFFVTAIETTFFDAFRGYFRTIRDRGPLSRIERAGKALERQTFALLARALLMQVILCAIVIMAAPLLVSAVGLQFQQIGILRYGILAALFQFAFLACTSLLLFFDGHGRYLALQVLFLVLQIALTLVSIALGPTFYGFGHLAACAVSAAAAVVVLDRTFRKLDYLTFAAALRQSMREAPARSSDNHEAARQDPRHDDVPHPVAGRPRPLLAVATGKHANGG